jgi:transcriptional regulator with XRE-family HTH domain
LEIRMRRDTELDPGFGPRMRELRMDRGLSLRALATRALSNKSQLQAFEAGTQRPSADTVRRIDEALDAGGELVGLLREVDPGSRSAAQALEFAPSWSRAVDLAAALWRDDANRRVASRLGFDASAFLTPTIRWLTSPLDERASGTGAVPVSEADVAVVREATAMFRSLDNHYGGGHIRERVVRFLHAEVTPLLLNGRFDDSVGRDLVSAAAELTQLAGWASYDVGLHGLGQRYLIQALRLAMTAGDRPLGAEILAAMSHQASYLRAASQAVDLARAAARTAADAGVAAIVAEAAVLEAQGLAVQGDEAGCAVALDRAERTLDRADRASDPQWIGYFDEAYLSAKFGHCFAELGRGDLARRFATRSLEMDGRFARGRQFNLSLLAKAYVQVGDIDEAALVGAEAADLAGQLHSARSQDYLRDVAERLAPHVGLPVVQDFVARAQPVLGRT